jgi:hypothetical protein
LRSLGALSTGGRGNFITHKPPRVVLAAKLLLLVDHTRRTSVHDAPCKIMRDPHRRANDRIARD